MANDVEIEVKGDFFDNKWLDDLQPGDVIQLTHNEYSGNARIRYTQQRVDIGDNGKGHVATRKLGIDWI